MLLIKFEDNYADEFDTQGFRVMSQEEYDKFLASARQAFINASATEMTYCNWTQDPEFNDKEVEVGFGTNEYWTWCSYEEFMCSIKCERVGWASEVCQLFPEAFNYGYGMFPGM